MMRLPFNELRDTFHRILTANGFSEDHASICARIFAENSLDGIASHGYNRFPEFIRFVRDGYIKPDAQAERVASFAAWEQWDGHSGPGPVNAAACTEQTLALARVHGIGCVGLRNTNHWMRGGTYGRMGAEAGFVFLCWTNTTPNMAPWGAADNRLGNNPLVLAVPREAGPVVLDMAMTQFSYGKLQMMSKRGERLPVMGGFDGQGNLTDDPAAILKSQRPLSIGYWKGAGLSMVLDLMAMALSGGLATYQIGQREVEHGVSQVFMAVDVSKGGQLGRIEETISAAIDDLHATQPHPMGGPILYPGERVLKTRQENLEQGIAVDEEVWERIRKLR